jgi:hypothetical protein
MGSSTPTPAQQSDSAFNGSGSLTGKAAISGYLVDARPVVPVRRST